MALNPINEEHALQIQAGILGRKTGHKFEDRIVEEINNIEYPFQCNNLKNEHIFSGCPATQLLNYIGKKLKINYITSASAISTGALATSEDGKKWLSINGILVKKCKSDLVVSIDNNNKSISIGISTKQCNNPTPTNAQLFFTTANAFSELLRNNGIPVSHKAENSMKQFCGEPGFRPLDNAMLLAKRNIDPRRYFWEEIEVDGKNEWENIFSTKQDEISKLLLQKAYIDDPFIPEFVLHKTKKSDSWDNTEVAIYTIDELILLSKKYCGFNKKPYRVNKGSHRDPEGVFHEAPRFGIIQMQRGGQKQHPTQLQFNLEAGYFYKI